MQPAGKVASNPQGGALGPFFQFSNGEPLTRELLVKHLQGALQKAGVDASKLVGHSFRIGAATTASAMEVEDSLIKTLGRWKSSAYLLYVHIPQEKLASMSCTLARQV